MKATMRLVLVLAIGSVVFGSVVAGTLDPPGPPAPTMVTLQQIYDKVSGICAPADVAKTGQTGCWDASGASINCAATGQDGTFQTGVSVSPRFTDNGDGTVKDNLTGLIWLKNPACFGASNWTQALADANTLASGSCGLTDGSAAGDWRLPNVKELQSLIDYGHFNTALPSGHPFSVYNWGHWSSTSSAGNPDGAWAVGISNGSVGGFLKSDASWYVWPVRGGQ